MDINKFFQSKMFSGFIFGLVAFIILLLIFKAGLIVGIKKADFSCRWSDNYQHNFGGPGFGDRDFIEANGTFGQIIKLEANNLVVKGRNDVEKIIIIDENTVIKNLRQTLKPADLKIDDNLVIIGEPNELGQIKAKLIRLMPPRPTVGPGGRVNVLPRPW